MIPLYDAGDIFFQFFYLKARESDWAKILFFVASLLRVGSQDRPLSGVFRLSFFTLVYRIG